MSPPRYVDSQPSTLPAPSRDEWLQAGEAATDMGTDADEPDGSGIVWAVLIGLGLLLVAAVVGVTGRAMGVW